MGAAGRILIGLVLVSMAACATPLAVASAPKSFIPWQPLPAAHQSVDPAQGNPGAPVVPAGTPECDAAQLEGVGLAGGAAAGNVDWPLLLRNKGASDCFLEGFADVTVLDRAGRVLAAAVGATGRGTFFSDAAVKPVLMVHGTPALPAAFQARDGYAGQALMNFSWYDCQQPRAAMLVIGLPDGRGSFRIAYATEAAQNPRCPSSFKSIARGPLSASGELAPYIDLSTELNAPAQAKPGTQVTYYVTIRNQSIHDYTMQPCPDYFEGFDGKQYLQEYQLNCGPAGTLKPGASATFEMRLDVPKGITSGTRDLSWNLSDARLAGGAGASAPLRIS